MSLTKNRLAFATMGIGLALQAFFFLWIIIISLEDIQVIFLIEAIFAFCYVLGILLFTLGITLIIMWRFEGWKGWALILKSMALISMIVSFLVMGVAFYAVILMVPQGLWGTYQGWTSGTMAIYGAIVTWLSLLTLFLLAYVLILRTRYIQKL
jgi:hypothetical protein